MRRENRSPRSHRRPPLRLTDAPRKRTARPTPGPRVEEAGDPRWVLAVRTAEKLEGTLLAPEKRERLVQLGKTMGLSVFDANLVIAIVQDQARRGHRPELCARAGAEELRMVPLPRSSGWRDMFRGRQAVRVAWTLIGLLAGELMMLWAIFGG
ncbi:MAG: hypothetical protein ACLFV3_08175 [Phycisphaeraceae bacterium]